MSNAEELALDAQQRIARFVNGARETLASYLQVAVERGYKGAIYYWCTQGDGYVFSINIQAGPPRFPIDNLVGNVEKYDLTGNATRAQAERR